jgi:hypothetical protein
VIVVVEGPSAAGKTTWCRRNVGRFVAEYSATGREPVDAELLARYWARVGSRRWGEAVALETSDGVAVCDTDPLKLHWSWGMAALGLAPRAQFDRELAVTREAFRAGMLGFADAVLVGLPDVEALRRRRDGDPTRRRRNFAAHVQLREPLEQWYRAIDRLDPGRVFWDLPVEGLPKLPEPRAARTSPELLDALVAELP